MREDIPEWLGKPPRRGTDAWEAWLAKWRAYARAELKDTAADDPEFDFGLLTMEERWQCLGTPTEIKSNLLVPSAFVKTDCAHTVSVSAGPRLIVTVAIDKPLHEIIGP